MKIFKKRCEENNILYNPEEIFKYLKEFPHSEKTTQTKLF